MQELVDALRAAVGQANHGASGSKRAICTTANRMFIHSGQLAAGRKQHHPPPWMLGAEYQAGQRLQHPYGHVRCLQAHIADVTNAPHTGERWEEHWERIDA